MIKQFTLFLIASLAVSFDKEPRKAEVSYYDFTGTIHKTSFNYYIQRSKAQFGVRFGVNIYQVSVQDCYPIINGDIEEFFAAYLVVPEECYGKELIVEVQNHGADFIFLDISQVEEPESLKGNNYKIPIFLIENYSEQNFFRFSDDDVNKRNVSIFFEMPKASDDLSQNFVKLDFYYVPSYSYSLKFIKALEEVYSKLKDRILFEPHIVTFSSKSQEFITNNCVSQGAYCAFDPETASIDGKMVIMESLRQKCVYKIGISLYFQYMNHFYSQCVEKFTQECSDAILYKIGGDSNNIAKCVSNSFHDSNPEIDQNENDILASEKEFQKNISITAFPNIFVNNNLYKGSLSTIDLLLSLCSSLHDETQECHNLSISSQPLNKLPIFIFFITLFLVCFIILAYVCKYIAKRKYIK